MSRRGYSAAGAPSALQGIGSAEEGAILVGASSGRYTRKAKSANKGWGLGTGPVSGNVDYYHPYLISPPDRTIIAQSYDPDLLAGFTILSTYAASGTLKVEAIAVAESTPITAVELYVATAGVTLTATRNWVALYNASGALIAQSVDQSTNWQSTGWQAATFATPPSVVGGVVYVGISWAGTTAPAFARAGLAAVAAATNRGLMRSGTAQTGLTTTAPASIGTFTAGNLGPLVLLT